MKMTNDIMPPQTDDAMEPGDMRSGPAEKWTVQDIQGPHATVSNGKDSVRVPLELLPKGAKPGDQLDDDMGSLLTNDPTGDNNQGEQDSDVDVMKPGSNGRRPMEPDSDPDDVSINPTQNTTKMRMR